MKCISPYKGEVKSKCALCLFSTDLVFPTHADGPDVLHCSCVKEAATLIAALQTVAEVVDGYGAAVLCSALHEPTKLVLQSSRLWKRLISKK